MRALVVGSAVALAVILWPVRLSPYPGSAPVGRRRSLGGPLSGGATRIPLRRLVSRRPAGDPGADILDLLDALAPALRAGLPPAAALRAIHVASGGSGLASELLAAADQGAPLGFVWRGFADQTGSRDIAQIAAAWSLCDALGSPLAPTVATVAEMIRRRQAVQRRIDVAVAGPRATMRLLIALPLVGPLLALSVGVSPTQLYASPAGFVPFAVGGLLLLGGWRWSRRLIVGVVRERPDG